MELLSHPDKTLREHIERGVEYINNMFGKINISTAYTSENKLREAVKLSYIFHDIGKTSGYFQEYIRDTDNYKGSKNKKKHSLLSAFISYKAIKHIIDDALLSAMCYTAILWHHSDLDEIENALVRDLSDSILKDQYTSIEPYKDTVNNLFSDILSKYGFEYRLDLDFSKSEFEDMCEHITEGLDDVYFDIIDELEITEDNRNTEYSFMLMLIYSGIIFADKSEAIFNDELSRIQTEYQTLETKHIDEYKATFSKAEADSSKSKINKIREAIYKEALSNIADNSFINLEKDRVLTLTVPTGGGKTITSLALATKINEITGKNARIIYAFPFVSLIEQSEGIFTDILSNSGIDPENNNNILKHYYLSDANFNTASEDKYNVNEAQHLIETWNSNLIVTTFVQLTNTFFGMKNRYMKRLPRLANSIIILDEVQSFPVKYHKLFSKVIKSIADMFNIHFIFMSATMPYIFDEKDSKEILKQPEKYYTPINRTKMNYEPEVHIIDDIVNDDSLIDKYKLNDTSFLFVCNTVKSSIAIYEYLKKELAGFDYIGYISTNIVPAERYKRIKNLKDMMGKGCKVCGVTTQLIEAGVDIDFPKVIRDFAPLDSINQVGGRCNRNGFDECNDYYVIRLKDGDYDTKRIYDPVLNDITHKLLEESGGRIPEKYFYDTACKYFMEMKNRKSPEFYKLWNSFCRMSYKDFDFKLIDNYITANVFVCADDSARQVWEKYETTVKNMPIKSKEDFFKRKENFQEIKKDFNSYIINLPQKHAKELEPVYEDGDLFVIRSTYDVERLYDTEAGFKRFGNIEADII